MNSLFHFSRLALSLVVLYSSLLASEITLESDWNDNSISDVWEVAYGYDPDSALADPDGDGFSNQREAEHGTNPYDPQSVLRVSISLASNKSRLLKWQGKAGHQYVVQAFVNSGWQNVSARLVGKGTEMAYAVTPVATGSGFFRILLPPSEELPNQVGEILAARDTDQDGQSDWVEWLAGSSVIDQTDWFKASLTAPVSYLTLRWSTGLGLDYYLESLVNNQWIAVAGPFTGDGLMSEVNLERKEPKGIYRVRCEAQDRDGDGLLDWEEHLAGLDPNDAKSGDALLTDQAYAQLFASQGGSVELASIQPILRVGEATEAIIKLRRKDGLAPLKIPLTITGSAISSGICSVSPAVVSLGLGQREAVIKVKFQDGVTAAANSDVFVGIVPAANYSIGHFGQRSVNIVNESLVNVMDHGAVGDGVTNDIVAIQSAIHAMEMDASKNGLFFPSGTYRIATIITDNDSPVGSKRMLKLGSVNLSGRDILLKGAPGSCLYSDPGTTRANLLLALATFRSLTLDGLRLEKSPQPLSATPGHEPNGSGGLAVAAQGNQPIEGVFIRNCEFINCHSSVTLYANGYDIRGFGGCFHMSGCQVLNPYGANTLNSTSAFGGGQQIAMSAWVADAIYENCTFDGGAEDMTNQATSPGGVLKDGCHFGCPLHLVFKNNFVYRMGVEAVFQTGGSTYMGYTVQDFIMPFPGNEFTVEVSVSQNYSTYQVGEFVNIRTPLIPGSIPSSSRMIVREYSKESSTLLLSNSGYNTNLPPNTVIPASRSIYKDNKYEPTFAVIEGNVIDGLLPNGGVAFVTNSGISSEAKCIISNNLIKNFHSGIYGYHTDSTPSYQPGRGLLVNNNLVVTRNAQSYPAAYTYGIQTFEDAHRIHSNMIIAPVAWKTVGIGAYGRDTMSWDNTVIADQVAQNGYFSSNRSVGIGYGNTGFGFCARNNYTRGFDVGLGSMDAYAGIYVPYRMKEHKSIQDVLAFDPIGLLPWQ
jgi:hypothetical protein